MPYRILTLFTCLLLLLSSSLHAEDKTQLVVTWLEGDKLMVWRTGDAAPMSHQVPENIAGNIGQLLISADGQYVAANATNPGSLWLAAPTNPNLIEAVPNQAIPTTDDPKYSLIDNLQRGENTNFYFNTGSHPSHYNLPNNDLWSIDAASLTFKLLVPPQEAGLFKLSPDGQHIAIIQAGTYGTLDGKIILANKDGENPQEIMTFSAVSSGSDNDFYPQLNWETDSSAFNIAIPHKDLIYNDNTAMTTLWHIAIDGTKTQTGTLQATIFGLPQWSDDGEHLLYLRHKGDISSNQFELMIASGDGTNATVYVSGTAGDMGVPQWRPNSNQFIYQQGEPGHYMLGQVDQTPQALPDKIFNPHFVDSPTYVYATSTDETFELRYARLGEPSSTLIATVQGYSVFDALLVP